MSILSDSFCLEITVICRASPPREVGQGPSKLLPYPLSPSPISERPGQPAHGLPQNTLPLSPSLFPGVTLPSSTRHSSCRSGGGLDTHPWIFSLQEAGGRRERRCWELGAGEGSLLAKAPDRPFLIFSPFPRVTSNHVFLLHTLLTRSGSETSHRPPHTHSWQGPPPNPGLGRGETWAQRKRVEARCAGDRIQASTSGHWG